MKEILTRKGEVILIDDIDYEWFSQNRWCIKSSGYAHRGQHMGRGTNGKWKTKGVLMHHEVLKPPEGMFIDHINHNKLDNRRENLRVCTKAQNQYNRNMKPKTSCYKGVSRGDSNWVAVINIDGKRKHLGSYINEKDAAIAHDRAAFLHHGEFAYLNFPDDTRMVQDSLLPYNSESSHSPEYHQDTLDL